MTIPPALIFLICFILTAGIVYLSLKKGVVFSLGVIVLIASVVGYSFYINDLMWPIKLVSSGINWMLVKMGKNF